MNLGLKNCVAIVGGSSSGIGKAIALALAEEECSVVLCGRNKEKLSKARKEINKKTKAEVVDFVVDQSNHSDIKKLVAFTLKKFKRIDVLVTNTGGPRSGGFFEVSEEDWLQTHESLFMYVVRIYNEVIPIMKKQRFGRIINNTSFTVKQPAENLILSNVYRTAVASLAKSISRELAGYNITVNNICPGYVDTDRLRELFGSMAKKEGLPAEKIYQRVKANMPIGRLQMAKEIAALAVFLASEQAGSITGATIQDDGGLVKGLF